jgi:hypothetical protein
MNALLNSSDPEIQRATKRNLKKIDPKLNFPELDIEDTLEKRVQPLVEDNKKLREELQAKEWNAQVEKEHARGRQRGFVVDDVQKLMKEKGIVSFDTAMDMLEMQQTLATPTPESLSGVYEMPEDQKDIFKNPAQWARKQAHAIIDQMKRKPQRA